ncbi:MULTISPECIES: DUF6246 family protein [Pantoea]|uniref:DUF6246 family protein n=1 Tax=Pantoea TaxID=53335 RepID=UPI002598E0CC|nr:MULTISPECIES: DUF6246 family protein [Pantoea]
MTPLKEIGEVLITVGEEDYFFRPSFINMTRIGEPEEIVQALYDLHNDEAAELMRKATVALGYLPAWIADHCISPQYSKKATVAAMTVLQACSDQNVTSLTGEVVPGRSGKWTFVYRKGHMTPEEMIIVSRSLMAHGIVGKAKVRRLQRHEGAEASTEFNAFEYISAARTHLGMSREEAEQLTMTDFQLLLAAKYPEQKGFTREEYEAAEDAFLAKQARKQGKQK